MLRLTTKRKRGMQREDLERGRDYYVLGLTTKGHFLSHRTVAFPVIDGDDGDRIPSGATALQVFADSKRAAEYLGLEMRDRARAFTEATGEEIRAFSINYMKRQEVKAAASRLGADYILVEQADGRFTVDDV